MESKRQITKRFHVKAFFPKHEMVSIAQERTEGIVSAYIFEHRPGTADLLTLARSCYMQGLHDAIDSMKTAGWKPMRKD